MNIDHKYDVKKFVATQKLSDLSALRKGIVYREWQHKLNRGDRLPRGKWFEGKKAGKPFFIMDEAHMHSSRSTVMRFAPAKLSKSMKYPCGRCGVEKYLNNLDREELGGNSYHLFCSNLSECDSDQARSLQQSLGESVFSEKGVMDHSVMLGAGQKFSV